MSALRAKLWFGAAMMMVLAGCQPDASSPAPGLVPQAPSEEAVGPGQGADSGVPAQSSKSSQPSADSMLQPDSPTGTLHFSAKLEMDKEPGGKRFQGVWLVREDGQRWVVDYRASEFWKPFEGATVEASGEIYYPEGQAISATHFRVDLLTVDPKVGTSWVELGPQRTLGGSIQSVRGEAGSKLEGESWPVFVADDKTSYQLANPVQAQGHPGAVEVVARAVKRSPFTAHMPGPTLWLIEVSNAPAG